MSIYIENQVRNRTFICRFVSQNLRTCTPAFTRSVKGSFLWHVYNSFLAISLNTITSLNSVAGNFKKDSAIGVTCGEKYRT